MNEVKSIFFWVFSPTYKFAEKRKKEIFSKEEDVDVAKNKLTNGIKSYNNYYFFATIIFSIIANFLFQQSFYGHEYYKWINYSICLSFGWTIFFSRAVEIFKAFMDDAVDKLNGGESSSKLSYGDRLKLALKSYIELMFGFGTLYYILPSHFFNFANGVGFDNVIQAIYFSGITMTTIGYGDISPAVWLTRCLVIFQVLCGLTLALVSFTIYSSLALAGNSEKERG
ncbi:potassium channel family protein [Janthinobacterium sp. SUN033]|uniref:potassium channel family protein n=1 Tax=Janthinobacterium sp. SUN033 TaxID=3002439 RepID=UPI0025B028A0|nr:potassium channel family protein [Janthinobacterium sp. SUN033]MDN2676844.1 potassium channel family protein [Janthinobacterium sp. SUN033]